MHVPVCVCVCYVPRPQQRGKQAGVDKALRGLLGGCGHVLRFFIEPIICGGMGPSPGDSEPGDYHARLKNFKVDYRYPNHI